MSSLLNTCIISLFFASMIVRTVMSTHVIHLNLGYSSPHSNLHTNYLCSNYIINLLLIRV
ncbi:hypothetical protein EQ875_00423 [Photobacterium damselae subsp. damselae]|uniref:Uncharacterized protein n=1 Tax=Photobacterium damselae TaxID=38293 RepID=A0A2X1WFH1_PHODM|nr:hypothetical protein EQ875_00423 [Photobacterium damselae subsp. damselae]SPY27821.1 Uncharacterised protein [Photobacterium damselae]